jgi:Pheophorbide a oxygenase
VSSSDTLVALCETDYLIHLNKFTLILTVTIASTHSLPLSLFSLQAHHNLQGKRTDAIPINMTITSYLSLKGFTFDFDDRTMKMNRKGQGDFRAPYLITYTGTFDAPGDRTFNLTACMIPTKPGWSRIILLGTSTNKDEKESPMRTALRKLPTWFVHLFSNKFLDSDLMFLHGQENERERRDSYASNAYFMPAPADRCIVALRQWFTQYAKLPERAPIPASVLFDRYEQHTTHCQHCSKSLKRAQAVRKTSIKIGAVSLLLVHQSVWAGAVAASSLVAWRLASKIEEGLKTGGFTHYDNH